LLINRERINHLAAYKELNYRECFIVTAYKTSKEEYERRGF
jgi:hypothetical protein